MEQRSLIEQTSESPALIAEEVASMTGDKQVLITRGLTRTRLVGRSASGSPITHEGLLLEEIMRQNEQAVEREREVA